MSWKSVKKSKIYRELYYLCRVISYYKKLGPYIRARFIIGPRILKSSTPLDRPVSDKSYSIHTLCSHNDLLLLFWSLKSWYDVTPSSGNVYIHEDGSFTVRDYALIARLLPHAEVVDYQDSTQKSVQWLTHYPKTLSYRAEKKNILMVKLVDPYFTGDAPMRLILDTDMLWFMCPDQVIESLKSHTGIPFMMQARQGIFKLGDGSALSQEWSDLNSGIVGYCREDFNLDAMERFFSLGTPYNHFIEQAGYAWILNQGRSVTPLDQRRYVIKADAEGSVLKHFTGPRREEFWFEGVGLLGL